MRPLRPIISGRVLVVVGFICVAGCDCETTLRNFINQTSEETRTQLDRQGDADDGPDIDDREPNDTRARASSVTLAETLEPIRGTVAKPGDLDWYKLTTESAETWVVDFAVRPASDTSETADVTTNGADVDPYAVLATSADESAPTYRYDGPASDDDQPLAVRRVDIGGSPLWLGIGGQAGTTGRYAVEIQKRLSASAVEREPNDTKSRATTMSYPGEVQGFFDREGDVDLYKLPKQDKAAAIHRLQLAPTHTQPYRLSMYRGSPDGDPFVSYTVPSDDRLTIPNLGIPVAQSDVWLRVTPLAPDRQDSDADQETRGKNGSGADAGVRTLPDPTASYRIRIIRHPPAKSFKIEGEPNDSTGGGFRLELGTPMRGYLHTSRDRDVIRVAVGDPPERADAGQGGDASAATPEDVGVDDKQTQQEPDAGAQAATDPYAALPDKDPPANLIQVGVETLRENRPVAIDLLGHARDPSKHTTDETDESGRATVCNVPLTEGFVEVAVSRPRGVESTGLSRGYDYQLFSVDVLPNLESVEIEPNDSRDQADRLGSMAVGTPEPTIRRRTGFLTSTGDRDVFAFRIDSDETDAGTSPGGNDTQTEDAANGPASGSGGMAPADAGSATGSSGGRAGGPGTSLTSVKLALKVKDLDLRFTVTDAAGAPIAKVDRAGPASDEKTQLDLPAGVYFVTVESRRAGSCSPYQLSVQVQ